jgi:hypothetical protein
MNPNIIENVTTWLSSVATEILCFLGVLLESNFTIALIGSLSGAFGGAIAAQRVIERTKRREVLLSEFRNNNAAIVVSLSICNSILSLKKQHSLPLYEKFKADQAAIEKFNENAFLGNLAGEKIFQYEADFKIFSAPSIPIDTLKDLVFNKISANGRALRGSLKIPPFPSQTDTVRT